MVHQKTKNEIINWLAAFFLPLALFFFAGIAKAQGASFSLSTPSGSYEVGDTISVTVSVNSPSQSINAVSGTISFPANKLTVTSISKSNTIVNLWVQDPTYSNAAGTVNFQGVVLNPGFTGSSGELITINLEATAPGIASVSFTSGSILANDGQGTNIIDPNGLPSNQYAINVSGNLTNNASVTTPSYTNGPLAPVISSPTHPDSTKWYPSNDVKLTWTVPSGVDAVRLLYDKYPNSIPTVLYNPPINEKELTGLDDGVYYFHAEFHDSTGWGSIANFKFQIDTTPPEPFTIKFIDTSDTTNPSPTVLFNTTDTPSGIAYYKVKIGDQDFFTVSADQVKSNPYTLPPQTSGDHNILVQAFDEAGNYQTALSEFTIQPINPPTITDYTRSLGQGGYVVVKGTTYPNATVSIWLESGINLPQVFKGASDSTGSFTVVGGNIPAGDYKMYATVTDSRGAESSETQKYDIVVTASSFLGINTYTVNAVTVILSLIALLLIIGGIAWYGIRRFKTLKKTVAKEARMAEHDVEDYIRDIRRKSRNRLNLLEKAGKMRQLTKEEELLLKELKGDLGSEGEEVKSDLDRIEKRLK